MLVPFLNFERGAGVCVHVLTCRIVNVLFGKFTSCIHSKVSETTTCILDKFLNDLLVDELRGLNKTFVQ